MNPTINKNEDDLIISNPNNTNQTTASSSGLGSSAAATAGMTTVISTDGSASGGSGSTDVPHSTGNNSNVEEGKKGQLNDNSHISPRKKVTQPIQMEKQALDNFQTLTSTKQNIELFKILTAIAVEIDGLQRSTEKRFSILEGLVVKVEEEQKVVSSTQNTARNEKLHQNNSSSKVTICILLGLPMK